MMSCFYVFLLSPHVRIGLVLFFGFWWGGGGKGKTHNHSINFFGHLFCRLMFKSDKKAENMGKILFTSLNEVWLLLHRFARRYFLKKRYTEFSENPTNGLVLLLGRRRTDVISTLGGLSY